MNSHEIRQKYLDFFKSKGHAIIPSSSLIPENDPTTLFTGSGMQPMVPYLLGQTHPAGHLLADSQKCFRSQDIEEVGDNRHTTFFEMLGNWSLGDYFKEKQIPWMFEFLTKELGLNPKKLYVTVFRGNDSLGIARDDESAALWQKEFKNAGIEAKAVDFSEENGMGGGRIFYYDENKNWWSRAGTPVQMPVGEPGGPDSEMFWDFGEKLNFHKNSPHSNRPCHVNCDCGRFMEIGNNVFMEYKKTADGFEKLSQRNVDFGGGLERMAAAVNNEPDIFRIDIFNLVIKKIEELSGKKYPIVDFENKYVREFSHTTIGKPSHLLELEKKHQEEANEKLELLRLFRIIADHVRAATFLIGDGVLPSNKDQGYFVRRLIRRAVRNAYQLGISSGTIVPFAEVFINIYRHTYRNLEEKCVEILSEIKKEELRFMGTLDHGLKKIEKLFPIGKIEKIESGNEPKIFNRVDAKSVFDIFQSDGFPFELIQEELAKRAFVVDEKEFAEEFKKHQELSRAGAAAKFAGGLADNSEAVVHGHTATHLLHAALRKVLGEHVGQKGSNITAERLRFDFTHTQKMTAEELKEVEDMVNEQIKNDLPVTFEVLDMEESKKRGALGFFEDKYAALGGKIKVYSVGDEKNGYFSSEICGGPHVLRTSELKSFKILKEEAVSAGIRRIKAKVE